MSQPERPIEVFVDRSLGKSVAEALRGAGVSVRTLSDVYGEKLGSEIADTEWLEMAGKNDWVVLMKDKRIRYRANEKDALARAGVRAFCLTNGNLRGKDQIRWILGNLESILHAAQDPGPYIYGIYESRIRRLFP